MPATGAQSHPGTGGGLKLPVARLVVHADRVRRGIVRQHDARTWSSGSTDGNRPKQATLEQIARPGHHANEGSNVPHLPLLPVGREKADEAGASELDLLTAPAR